ncbi:MAG: hypothetical protein WCF18_24600 [Chthoniobacteraceae bacterium]
MDNSPPPLEKKGLGVVAWLGIGCGGIIVLGIIIVVAFTALYGGKIKQFAEDAQKNPTRTMATTMVNVSSGKLELVAEDDANKRYTIREKETGRLTTIYWVEAQKKAEVVNGDFSAIPATPVPTPTSEVVPAPK